MRITVVVPYFLPYKGGQENYVYHLSKKLVENGHDVKVISSNYPQSAENEIIDGIDITRCRCIFRVLRNPIYFGISKIIAQIDRSDIIHIHNEHSFSSLVVSIIKCWKRFPLIITCHGRLVFGNPVQDFVERVYETTLGRFVLAQADIIVVNSPCDRDYISALDPNFNSKICVTHNAIDPSYFENIVKHCSPHKNRRKFVILYVGRLIKRKGLEWLIKSIDIIKNKYNMDIECVLVGSGEDKDYFKQLTHKYNVSDEVIFKGEVANEELVSLYLSSDVFVLPSLSEVCPTVVMEAMYFSLPVVSTYIPGIYDHFNDVALLVPPKDETLLAESIMKLYLDEELRKKLSTSGHELICKKYTWHQISSEYTKIYETISGDEY